MRKDSDLLGELLLPDDVYYGAQTLRTLMMFPPSKETIATFPSFINAMGGIKKACAMANEELGILDHQRSSAIQTACDEVMAGKFNDQLVLDMLSGNDFAPIHMNFNEVIACRANEIITGEKGHSVVHPNTHVNMGTSTCDTTYTAVRFALYHEITKAMEAVQCLRDTYAELAEKYKNSVKVSHTCFQDASPIGVGQFYGASASMLTRQLKVLENMRDESLEHAVGYTVIGTGLGSFQGFHEKINDALQKVLGIPTRFCADPFDDRQYADYFLRVSAAFKSVMTGASKMARDVRVMSSGPRAGFSEITIAPVQNGSSFFPGKVNPSLAELVNIACYQVCGLDTALTMAVEAGELDCSPWYPIFAVSTLNQASYVYRTLIPFAQQCVATIQNNEDGNRYKAERSLGMASAASALFGYKHATAVAQYASKHNIPVKDAVVELGLMDKEQAYVLFDPLTLCDVEKSSELMSKSAAEDRY